MIVYDIINTRGMRIGTYSSLKKTIKVVEYNKLLYLKVNKRHTNFLEWLWSLV